MWWPHCSIDQVWARDEDKAWLQCSQHCHKSEFWHINIIARQRSWGCGQNVLGSFLRATTLQVLELLNITSGNHTPGSRSYSELVDTWADCILQLVLKPCSNSASTMAHSNSCTITLRIHSRSQDTLWIGHTLASSLGRSIARSIMLNKDR